MRKNLIDEISNTHKITKLDLIEKDIIIHEIMSDLSKTDFFRKNFLFKGGTCLVKSFLGYFRFSEDIDFTWKDQTVFQSLSVGKLRSTLSQLIDQTGKIVETIAKNRDFDFKCEKSNNNYVELGGSNKICTFKIWYNSEILNKKTFLKMQINFVEKILFSVNNGKLSSLATKNNDNLKILFGKKTEYLNEIDFDTYNPKEILCEKIRAILTRQGTKTRDFLDAYLICKNFKIKLTDIEEQSVEKLNFSLKMYEKYQMNFKTKIKIVESDELFTWGEEKYLLLKDMKEEEERNFFSFIKELGIFLKTVIAKIET